MYLQLEIFKQGRKSRCLGRAQNARERKERERERNKEHTSAWKKGNKLRDCNESFQSYMLAWALMILM